MYNADSSLNKFFIINCGSVKLTSSSKRETMSTLISGDFFGKEEVIVVGEIALVANEPIKYTAEALSDVEVYTISRSDFELFPEQIQV